LLNIENFNIIQRRLILRELTMGASGVNRTKKKTKTIYPKSLKDIPPWRNRQLEQDLPWFLKYPPVKRLQQIDGEWEEIQAFINKFGFQNHGTRKRS
jgi:hypothetical protein